MQRSSAEFRFEVSVAGRRFEIDPYSGLSSDSEMPWVEMEALWAPDSSAFALSWNETAITTRSQIFTVQPGGVRQLDLTRIRKSFARKYSLCIGEPKPCNGDSSGLSYNNLSVAWAAPHTVVLMAEVPPSSSVGRNMGKVNGYEIDALTGRVVRVLTPAEFKKRWQAHLGWTFNVRDAD